MGASETLDSSAVGDAFLVTEPEWSRDGKRIAFAGGAWPDLDVFVYEVSNSVIVRVFGATRPNTCRKLADEHPRYGYRMVTKVFGGKVGE